MRICFLAAGDSQHSHRWIRFFAERGHEVHWLSLVESDRPIVSSIGFQVLGGRWTGKTARGVWAATEVGRAIRDFAPDLVHAHYAGWYGLLGMLARVRPFVVTAWGSDVLFAGRARIRGALVRRVLMAADLVTCDAYHMAETMMGIGVDPGRIEIIYFGVETDVFRPGPKDEEVLRSWGAQGRPVVISLRNLEPVYDVGTLIEAVPLVRKRVPDVLVVIAGRGSQEGALRERARALGLDDHVRFIGRYEHRFLPRMLCSADVYVSTSLSDAGIAASTAEAMACGVPVVVTDIGENERWIDDGTTGLLVPARDPSALASQIIRVLEDRDLAAAMGEKGRAVIAARNDYRREMWRMELLYRRLVGGMG